MQIDDAKLENGWLCLKTQPTEAYKWLRTFEAGEYEIRKEKKIRSKNANAMAWALIGKIAAKTDIPSVEVYKSQIRDIGGQETAFTIKRPAFKMFQRAFCNDHIARSVDIIGEDDFWDTYDVLVRYGSSDYDTPTMTHLIDNIIQDCAALGIETPEDEYIAQLIEDWEKTHEK